MALRMEGLICKEISRLKLVAVALLVLVLLIACEDGDAGDLVTSISISGSIAFPITRTVIFETQGTLGRQLGAHGVAVGVGGESPPVVVRLRPAARRVRELS